MHAETLIIQLNYNLNLAKMNCAGVTEEQALIQPQPGGNCLNWVMGHVTATRNSFLSMLGSEPLWTAEEKATYDRGSAPITGPGVGLTIERIMADYEASQQPIIKGLQAMGPEQFAAKAPFSPMNDENETVGSLLAGLLFHEAYHVGQTGVLRRLTGQEGALK